MFKKLDERLNLRNSTGIPCIGLGVSKIPNDQTAKVVYEAIKAGYRLIDAAYFYKNEKQTGLGIKEAIETGIIKREDIFVTSKVWNDNLSFDETIKAYEQSLENLGLDYLDLYLIHWPGKDAFTSPYKALEHLYKLGKVKDIGVCNFQIHHLEALFSFAEIKPSLNQIEFHPKLTQKELRDFCAKNGIVVQAWSPLMRGGEVLTNGVIKKIADKHNKTNAQIVLRWCIQQGVVVITKSVDPQRLKSNADIFDFALSEEDVKTISYLNEDLRIGPHPDKFNFKF